MLFLIPVLKDGSGIFLTNLAKGLKRFGWDISLVSVSRSGDWVEWKDLKEEFKRISSQIYEIDFFNRSSQVFWESVSELLKVLEKDSFGILAPQSCVPASACVVCRDILRVNMPIVLTFHSWGIDRPDWMNLWDSWALTRVDHICFVSEGYRSALLSKIPFRIDNNKTSVIRPGLYINDIYPSKEVLRERFALKYKVPKSSLWITTLGGISERKGHLELIKAFEAFISSGADAYLFLIGPVRERGYFKEMLSVFKRIPYRVKFLGYIKDPYSLIKASDVFIFPSKSEGLGLALMEAMALGVPCISSNIEGTEDLVCGGEYALPLGEIGEKEILKALLYALENYGDLLYISVKAKERVLREFGFEKTLSLYDALYKKFLKAS
ncbi:MAG: glycosyltransferase family 4 protein [Synergistetes bacterium]|nr:glycosyltransferase family 4 protein [Synergistota bacterium]MCX8128377.1 glycosyltransferase family 4 protein [Synergistota bacterium]MDW8192965.1 glycosyltransferase family 4 protein [Synergistota bacterium]